MKILDNIWVNMMNAGAIYGCHQKPERSFFIKGYQFPVCARCAGILFIKPIAWLLNCIADIPSWGSIFLIIPMAVDGTLQYLLKTESTNKRRFITGLFGGFAISTLRINLIKNLFTFYSDSGRV
jgi:uncharacterized membrane protein